MKINLSELQIDGYVVLLAGIVSIPLFVHISDNIVFNHLLMSIFVLLILGRFVVFKLFMWYKLSNKYQTKKGVV